MSPKLVRVAGKQNSSNTGIKILLFVFIVILSIADLLTNVVSFIPFIGAILETIAETIFEILTIIFALILVLLKN